MSPVAFAASVTNYTYDANGNMVSDGSLNFSYDGSNNMANVTDAGSDSLVEQYFYDHSGNRIKKIENTSNGSITTYYVSDLFEVTVYPDGTKVNTSYYYANGERVAKKAVNGSDSETYYYHSDHLHSTSVVTRKGRLVAGMASADGSWNTVNLSLNQSESLKRPVVISKLMTENEADNSEERINNVTYNSFQLKVEETPSFDGSHASETMGYVALEEGLIANDGPAIGEAGTLEAGDIWTRVTFMEKFDEAPVVVASPMTLNNDTQGVVRIRNIGIAGFDIRFEEYSNGSESYHPLETLGWIAMEPGTWTLDGKKITAWTVGGVNDSYTSVSFQTLSSPVILSQIQSFKETDLASHTRVKSVSTTGFDVKIEEETDTTHTAETVGYIAIEPGTIKSGSAKVSETKYYPYGVTQEGGSDRYLYTGKELDKGTGLYYYEARYYNPNVGRFIQPDNIIPGVFNPQALNRYSYVFNNPLRYIDPSGHDPNKDQMGGVEDIVKKHNFAATVDHHDEKDTHNLEGNPSYVWTDAAGPIDLYHFSIAASWSHRGRSAGISDSDIFRTVIKVGEIIEWQQKWRAVGHRLYGLIGRNWDQASQHSYNSYEDPDSNLIGIAYGSIWYDIEADGTLTFDEFSDSFFEQLGGVSKEEIEMWKANPSTAPPEFNALPSYEDHSRNPPRKTTYGSYYWTFNDNQYYTSGGGFYKSSHISRWGPGEDNPNK